MIQGAFLAAIRRFRTGDMNGGLVGGIQEVASRLAELFPRENAGDVNELSDEPDV